MKPPWDGGTKVFSSGHGHTTKMAAMTIKTLKNVLLSGSKRPMTLKLSMQHWVLEYYQGCSNDDAGLTLICFMARSIWSLTISYGKKVKQWIFSEAIVVYDIKVGRCS